MAERPASDDGRPIVALLSIAAWLFLGAVLMVMPAVGVPSYLQSFVLSVGVPGLLPPFFLWLAQVCGGVMLPGVLVVVLGMLVAALPSVVSGAVGFVRGDLCAVEPGIVHSVLGPVMSGAMLAALARLAMTLFPRRRTATFFLYAVMAAFLAQSFWRMYSEPQAFALDHFFGHFRGPLYDEGTPSIDRPLALRMVTVAWIALMLSVASIVDAARRHSRFLVESVLAGLVSAIALWGVSLWTAPTRAPGRAGILKVLASEMRTPHAIIHYDGARLKGDMRHRVAWETERHISELQTLLRVPVETPIHVYLYPSDDEKGRLMGAAGTLLARPWAREIHVQGTALPIPALRHELAHVLLGELTWGPFKVASALGFIPHVLLIEGMATALEEHRGELTLMQQAAVMKKMGKLPSVRRMMGPAGFYAESGARAYVAAGSLIRFLHMTRGPEVLRRIYADGSLDPVNLPLDGIEKEWHAFLDGVAVPEKSTSITQRVFRKGSIVQRQCADEAADAWGEARASAERDLLDEAERLFRRILALDPEDDAPLLALLETSSQHGDDGRTLRVADELMTRALDPQAQAQVLSALARGMARDGDLPAALEVYRNAREQSEGPANQRQLDIIVWTLGMMTTEDARSRCFDGGLAVLRFILGTGPERARGRSDLIALERARERIPLDEKACHGSGPALRGLLHYLVGRQLVADDPQRAVVELTEAMRFPVVTPLLEREMWRQLGEAQEGEGRFGAAVESYRAYQAKCPTDGEREEAQILVERALYADKRVPIWE